MDKWGRSSPWRGCVPGVPPVPVPNALAVMLSHAGAGGGVEMRSGACGVGEMTSF